jgi:asparagine synthase (glutamine-hydrolysing)
MCGIAGLLARDGASDLARIQGMIRVLAHRGPDGERVQADGPAALGHRRLSIIDLSDASAEPMTNEDGSLLLVFNGEVYNFKELRQRLAPRHEFRSQGDAEVILHLYEEKGEEAVAELDGMFAFALWDRPRQRVLLARDRAGKKPLFYHDGPRLLAVASEVKGLLAHPGVPRERDVDALPLYLTHGYVPTPGTFYRHIRALPPGHWMVATAQGAQPPVPYWRVRFHDGKVEDDVAAEERLRELLSEAVRKRLVADVPLGAFLSGGLDSSAVVAFMTRHAQGRVRTFSIGFAGQPAYDETAYAQQVAQHLGTDHTSFTVEPKALDLIDKLVWHHDGPFGDSSAVPTYLLAELTRTKVTVALSGDGGDEVFAGYLRLYGGALSERMPGLLRRGLARTLRHLPEPTDRKSALRYAKRFGEAAGLPLVDRYLRWTASFGPELLGVLRPELQAAASPERLRQSFQAELGEGDSPLAALLQLNFKTYLLDDLLVKMDRMSMAHGLEARSPFLDTAVIEFGAALPDRLRMRWGKGKVLLRRALRGVLPEAILTRKKMGFGAPLGAWFRSDLDGLVKERLLQAQSPLYEHLRPEPVADLVRRHLAHEADLSAQIWSLLTLESWLRQEPLRAA